MSAFRHTSLHCYCGSSGSSVVSASCGVCRSHVCEIDLRLQHGLQRARDLEVTARGGPDLVDRDAIGDLDEDQALALLDVEHALFANRATMRALSVTHRRQRRTSHAVSHSRTRSVMMRSTHWPRVSGKSHFSRILCTLPCGCRASVTFTRLSSERANERANRAWHTLATCSMVTTTRDPDDVRSMAPPGPLTILPCIKRSVSSRSKSLARLFTSATYRNDPVGEVSRL